MGLSVESLSGLGSGLSRPECAVAHRSGCVFVPDWTDAGGIALVRPDGKTCRHLARDRTIPLRPNGIALCDEGVLCAHLGEETGAVVLLKADGTTKTVTDAIDGKPLPPANFVLPAGDGGLWLTVSTRRIPRAADYRPDASSGFVAYVDPDGRTSIAADGLGYTNECLVSPDGATLFVNETFGRRTSAFDITGRGTLTRRATVATFGAGTFPDGLAMDESGDLFVTSIVSNRVVRLRNGVPETIIEDVDADHLDTVEAAFQAGTMGRPHLDTVRSRRLRNISNLAFGGPDRRTAILGCLLGDRLETFRVETPGCVTPSWSVDISDLIEAIDLETADGGRTA